MEARKNPPVKILDPAMEDLPIIKALYGKRFWEEDKILYSERCGYIGWYIEGTETLSELEQEFTDLQIFKLYNQEPIV